MERRQTTGAAVDVEKSDILLTNVHSTAQTGNITLHGK